MPIARNAARGSRLYRRRAGGPAPRVPHESGRARVAVTTTLTPQQPDVKLGRCRFCDQPIHLVESAQAWAWVHTNGSFSCRDPECGLVTSTQAEPHPAPAPNSENTVDAGAPAQDVEHPSRARTGPAVQR